MWRQLARALFLAALISGAVAGCDSSPTVEPGGGSEIRLFGGVAVDEPSAARVGEKILAAGGSAADAAAAVYFALSVTYPSAASLGGGGVCLYHDRPGKKLEVIEFLTQQSHATGPNVTRPSAVPGNAIGFYALQARHGKLHWSQVVSPAENLARFGAPLSRALAKELSPVIAALAQDRVAREIFVRPDGTARKEGDAFHQTDLAETLSVIRSRGPEELYRGPLAKKFVAGVRAAGGTLTLDELKAYKPRWRRAVRIQWGSNSAFFPPPPAAAGMVEAQTLGMLIEGDLFDDSNPADFAHALAETEMRAYADRARWLKSDNSTSVPIDDLVSSETLQRLLANFSYDHHVPADQLKPPPVAQPENPSATGFVTFDREGSAAACALTMNNSFGTGRFAGDTGILLAANPDAAERGPLSLGPMIVVKHNTNQLVFAAAAGGGAVVPGGVAAPTALINVAARTLLGEEPLEKAIAAKRIHHGGNPDLTYHEPGFNADAINVLRNRGHRIAATRNLGLVNAMSCPDGLPRDPTTCVVRTDPRGSGLAVLLER